MNPNLKPATHIRRNNVIIDISGAEQIAKEYPSISAAKKAGRELPQVRVDKTNKQFFPHLQPMGLFNTNKQAMGVVKIVKTTVKNQ